MAETREQGPSWPVVYQREYEALQHWATGGHDWLLDPSRMVHVCWCGVTRDIVEERNRYSPDHGRTFRAWDNA